MRFSCLAKKSSPHVRWLGLELKTATTLTPVKNITLFLGPKELTTIRNAVESYTKTSFNSCLANLYHEGEQGMGWHQDNEKELGSNPTIASISFGAERRFDFRHKESREKISVILENGSLLIMSGETQTHWQHQLPKTKKIKKPRVNLTFRTVLC